MSQIIGIFEHQGQAVAAIEQLRQEGFGAEQVRVIAKNSDQSWRVDSETKVPVESLEDQQGEDWNGQLAVNPQPSVPAIPLAAASTAYLGDLGSSGLPGTTAAGMYGGAPVLYDAYSSNQVLRDLGLNESDAKKYRDQLENGHLLVIVESDPADEASAEMALRRGGASMIH